MDNQIRNDMVFKDLAQYVLAERRKQEQSKFEWQVLKCRVGRGEESEGRWSLQRIFLTIVGFDIAQVNIISQADTLDRGRLKQVR